MTERKAGMNPAKQGFTGQAYRLREWQKRKNEGGGNYEDVLLYLLKEKEIWEIIPIYFLKEEEIEGIEPICLFFILFDDDRRDACPTTPYLWNYFSFAILI